MEELSLVRKDEYLQNIENRMGLHMPNSADVIKREDYPDDDSYITALARRDLEMEENPRLVELKRKHYIQLEKQRQAEAEEARQKARQEKRAAAKLTAREAAEVAEKALAAANDDLRRGLITAQEFDDTRKKHVDRLESKALDDKVNGEIFNEWARAEIQRNRVSGNAGGK